MSLACGALIAWHDVLFHCCSHTALQEDVLSLS